MNVRPITPEFAVNAQLGPADLHAVHAAGFRSIVVARPDDEEADQPSIARMREAAAEAGLGFAAVPVRPGQITDADVARFSAAMKEIDGPVLGSCRTGGRAATLWALGAVEELGPDVVLSRAAAAGHDLGALRLRLAERHAAATGSRPPSAAQADERGAPPGLVDPPTRARP